jgi:hypothetical protein
MKTPKSSITKKPKPNHLRACITIHKRAHSSEISVSYTDATGITHRTQFCRSRSLAEVRLRRWFNRTTGIGFVTLLATSEILEYKNPLPSS